KKLRAPHKAIALNASPQRVSSPKKTCKASSIEWIPETGRLRPSVWWWTKIVASHLKELTRIVMRGVGRSKRDSWVRSICVDVQNRVIPDLLFDVAVLRP